MRQVYMSNDYPCLLGCWFQVQNSCLSCFWAKIKEGFHDIKQKRKILSARLADEN
jgi:hypothetical protein